MSQIPEHEHPDADHDFVNMGLMNWHALRSEWKRKPEDFDPSKVERTNSADIDMETMCKHLMTSNRPYRVPLELFIKALAQTWEE
mmetsp:Transcript_14646/g.57485  ORF Transcript_14646/g.57485 Transcript_14646/m.57485 type:complete len:85 (-) Transcript_14646:126-380(-)